MITSLEEAHNLIEQKDLQIQELNKKLHSTQLSLKMLQHQVEQLLRRVYAGVEVNGKFNTDGLDLGQQQQVYFNTKWNNCSDASTVDVRRNSIPGNCCSIQWCSRSYSSLRQRRLLNCR